jgi:hypothetical protein
MSVNKSNNNMGGAYGNLKKENELLKKKAVLSESNQNGIRLIMNETSDFKNITMTSETPFRWLVSDVESSSTGFEEDEEILFQAERKRKADARMAEFKRIEDEEAKADREHIIKINTKKIRANIDQENERLQKQIDKLKADIVINNIEKEAVRRGYRDAELIKQKTDEVKIAPKPEATPDGARERNTIARPKGGDIMLLFNEPALIKCVMKGKEYFAKVIPAQNLIKCCKADGTFNHLTDRGVKSHLTKSIKFADGKKKDIADESEPAKERTEWTKKDDWIKSCKGEQNLYSSSKDGWLETHFYDPKKSEWVRLSDVAFENVKLN